MFRQRPTSTTLLILLPLLAALLILYATCLVPISSIPSMRFEWLPLPVDKLAHYGLFFLLSWSICFVLWRKGLCTVGRAIWWAFMVPLIYGGAIELLQANFIEGRSGEWNDFVADLLGSLSAMLLFLFFRFYLKKRKC